MITLQIKRLKKSFGTRNILRDLTLEHAGGVLGISGSNGSGKSTLLKCMAGLLSPTRGKIIWKDGSEKLSRKTVRLRMGYAAPYVNLYDELSSFENLRFLANVRHRKEPEGQIAKWIHKLELQEVGLQPFGNLSTGQQQRLRLASALFHRPRILLLDEPGSNLDEAGKSLVSDIVRNYRDDHKLLVIASNNRRELGLCGRIFSVEKQQFI